MALKNFSIAVALVSSFPDLLLSLVGLIDKLVNKYRLW